MWYEENKEKDLELEYDQRYMEFYQYLTHQLPANIMVLSSFDQLISSLVQELSLDRDLLDKESPETG